MNCRQARELLTAGRTADRAARRHVADCGECGRFAQRLATVERALSEHHASIAPPAGFAARVQAQLPGGDDLIGWAALRLLPATLGLILLLSWLNLRTPESPAAEETADPAEAVLTWVLDPSTDLGSGS
jgi:hypothetical protein